MRDDEAMRVDGAMRVGGVRSVPPAVRSLLRSASRICVLSGAGMSAESGIPTFRQAQTGLWARYDPMELASPRAWAADPDLVWGWYRWRTALVARAQPNTGHRALARWATTHRVDIVTQNVDDLHERAGSTVLAHLHGSLFTNRCSRCETPVTVPAPTPDPALSPDDAPNPDEAPSPDDAPSPDEAPSRDDRVQLRVPPPDCPACGGLVRPGVVWFGEQLPEHALEAGVQAVTSADVVVVVGTSGMVHPAATLPELARSAGIVVIEVNPQPSALSGSVDQICRGRAGEVLPLLVELSQGAQQ